MRFEHFQFGVIDIDGVTYEHDLVVDPGEIHRRKKRASRKSRDAPELRATVGHYGRSLHTGVDSSRVPQCFIFGGVVELVRRETRGRVTSLPLGRSTNCFLAGNRFAEAELLANPRRVADPVLRGVAGRAQMGR